MLLLVSRMEDTEGTSWLCAAQAVRGSRCNRQRRPSYAGAGHSRWRTGRNLTPSVAVMKSCATTQSGVLPAAAAVPGEAAAASSAAAILRSSPRRESVCVRVCERERVCVCTQGWQTGWSV